MLYNVTSLVNSIILPTTEPSDIIGLLAINQVSEWYLAPEMQSSDAAQLHEWGIIPTIIMTEGCTFYGMEHSKGANTNVKRVTERLEAFTSTA